VLLRARQVFKIIERKAVAYDGKKQIFGATGNPITIAEFIIDKLAPSESHLFEESKGGGSKKADGSGADGKIRRSNLRSVLDNPNAIASGT
jgi:hypothetical protein